MKSRHATVRDRMDEIMYKKQMLFQRLVCFALLAASAIIFIYSLGLVTDLYDAFYGTMRNPNNRLETDVKGSIIYYDIQPFNSALTVVSIVLLICAIILFLTNTHSRRKYYIGNYISTGLFSVASVAASIWAIPQISAFKTQFLTTVDFEALKAYADKWGSLYTESTFWFDIGFVAFGLLLAVTVLAIVNLIWKINLMKEEAKLIKEGLED